VLGMTPAETAHNTILATTGTQLILPIWGPVGLIPYPRPTPHRSGRLSIYAQFFGQ
jgi:hypothetical protein